MAAQRSAVEVIGGVGFFCYLIFFPCMCLLLHIASGCSARSHNSVNRDLLQEDAMDKIHWSRPRQLAVYMCMLKEDCAAAGMLQPAPRL